MRDRPRVKDCPGCGRNHFEFSKAHYYCLFRLQYKELVKDCEPPLGSMEPHGCGYSEKIAPSFVWYAIRRCIYERDKYRCRMCLREGIYYTDWGVRQIDERNYLEVHHIVPRKDGGSDHPENLITLCSECHHGVVHKNLPDESEGEEMDLKQMSLEKWVAG